MKEDNGGGHHDRDVYHYPKGGKKSRSDTTTTASGLQNFYHKYKEAILFNKNLLIADTCSLFVSSLFAEVYFQLINSSYIADSIFTALVEYGVDTPIFFVLYYIDNRHKYYYRITQDEDDSNKNKQKLKKRDTRKIKSDIIRLLGAFSICDVMYVVIKIFVQYQLLQYANIQPYEAAIVSSLIGWAAFLVLINITMRAIRIFSSSEIKWYYGIILSISISNSIIFFSNPDVKVLYDNIILDCAAAIAVYSVLVVLYKQHKQKQLQQPPQQEKNVTYGKIYGPFNKTLIISLAGGLILWFVAEVIWAYYQVWLGVDNPFPSIADVLWLIGYGFFIYHLYKLFNSVKKIRTDEAAAATITATTTTTPSISNHKHLLITVVVVIAIASSYIATIFIFGGSSDNPFDYTQKHSEQDILGFIISIAYPILDGIMLVPAATILWSLRRADPAFTHWVLICTFIVMLTIGDIGFGYCEVIINEDVAKKQLWVWDTFYNASYICIAAALFWYNKFSIASSIPSQANGGRGLKEDQRRKSR
jgi:hypothetical protein